MLCGFVAVRLSHDLQVERAAVEHKCAMRWPERASAEALAVNRYSPHEWRNALPVRVALVAFGSLIDEECLVVGHNVWFDWSFVAAAFEREALAVPKTKTLIDTQSIAWPLVKAGHLDRLKLDAICTKYGISNAGGHRAMADVRRLIAVYAKMLGIRLPEGGTTVEAKKEDTSWAE